VNDWDLWVVAQSKSVERSREIDLIFERLIDFRDIEFVSREIEIELMKLKGVFYGQFYLTMTILSYNNHS